MREVIKYEAKDGHLFDDDKECYIYENNIDPYLAKIANIIHKNDLGIQGYDARNFPEAVKSAKLLMTYFDIIPKN